MPFIKLDRSVLELTSAWIVADAPLKYLPNQHSWKDFVPSSLLKYDTTVELSHLDRTCFSTMCSRNESELTEQPSFLISLSNNCSPENSRCLKSEDRLEGLPSRVMKHLSTSSHCVVGPLVTTQPEKCFPVVFTFPSVEVMLLSLEEIALNCL